MNIVTRVVAHKRFGVERKRRIPGRRLSNIAGLTGWRGADH